MMTHSHISYSRLLVVKGRITVSPEQWIEFEGGEAIEKRTEKRLHVLGTTVPSNVHLSVRVEFRAEISELSPDIQKVFSGVVRVKFAEVSLSCFTEDGLRRQYQLADVLVDVAQGRVSVRGELTA